MHNGIIENFQTLQTGLIKRGHLLTSETDTELIVHLIQENLDNGISPKNSIVNVLEQLEGAFALGIIFSHDENLMIAARRGSPLAIGIGREEMYLGSDSIALAPFTDQIMYLEDGDYAILTSTKVSIHPSTVLTFV